MPELNDIYQNFGNDIAATLGGDLMPVSGADRTKQRLLRRLLTNPGDYIFHPEYGAGLPAHVGDVLDIPFLTALIVGQVRLEESIKQDPAPVVLVQRITNGAAFTVVYTDQETGQPTSLSFNINR